MSKPEHGDKLPLKRRVFYFDIKTSQNRNKLKNYITRLGGTVGEFLDNRVKYLITDRNQKDWPVKDKNLINHEQSQTPEVPSNRVSDLLPRGKQLALRASAQPSINCTNQQQSSKSITDAIEIANRRGIKILQAQDVLDFCSIQIRQLENPNCDTPKTSPRIPKATIRQFKGAFIKLEDVEQRYRPSAKEFKEWPKIYFDADPFMCPFIPPSKVKKYSENNDGNVANTVETGGMTGNENNNGTNNANTNTNTNTNGNIMINNNSNISINININQLNHTATANNISSRMPGTPEIRGNYTMNTKTFEGLGIQTPKASTNATNDFRELNRPTPLRKQNALQYCEICGITFKSISEHINSTTHQSHLKQKENFKDLFSVIKSLPKWTDICQENGETENPSDTTNDFGVDFEYPHYPSLTPPSMPSTTITLTPCSTVKAVGGNTNTKGSFLPLHDYISKNNNYNSKNASFKVKEVNSLTGGFKMRQVNILGNLNNNNNFSNIANNININFKIFNSNYSYSNINNNSKNVTDIMNASKQDNSCKIVNDSRNINNFEQLFSDDDENINEDEIEASCFTPPLIPPLLYPELDIPEEILRQKTNTIINNEGADDNAYSLEF